MTLYAGLSGILNVEERDGRFRLRTAKTYEAIGSFRPEWSEWQRAADLGADRDAIGAFVDAILDSDTLDRLVRSEGIVHAAMCRGSDPSYVVVQREASPSYRDTEAREAVRLPAEAAIHSAMESAGCEEPWWPGVRDGGRMPSMGTSADLLGIDPDGRLLVIEAKPPGSTKGIVWAPAQVRLYAELFHHLVQSQPGAAGHIATMLEQRQRLGLAAPTPPITEFSRIVPVVAIGAGTTSGRVRERLDDVNAALPPAPHLEPLEVWLLDEQGRVVERSCP